MVASAGVLRGLLDHDERRIELAYAVLLALPGTPIVYYGDEIGMSDNVDLPDRDGLRTPMQWTSGPHGGFTTHASATIPAIVDAQRGFPRINVEAQRHESHLAVDPDDHVAASPAPADIVRSRAHRLSAVRVPKRAGVRAAPRR